MIRCHVGNGSAVHLSLDEEVTLCGREVSSIVLDEDATCTPCIERQPKDEPTKMKVEDIKAGDVVIFPVAGNKPYRVDQVGPIRNGYIKLTFNDGQVVKYHHRHLLDRA